MSVAPPSHMPKRRVARASDPRRTCPIIASDPRRTCVAACVCRTPIPPVRLSARFGRCARRQIGDGIQDEQAAGQAEGGDHLLGGGNLIAFLRNRQVAENDLAAGGMRAERPLDLLGVEAAQEEPHLRIGRRAAQRQATPAFQAIQLGPDERVHLTIPPRSGRHAVHREQQDRLQRIYLPLIAAPRWTAFPSQSLSLLASSPKSCAIITIPPLGSGCR